MSTKSRMMEREHKECNSFAMIGNAQKIDRIMRWLKYEPTKLDQEIIEDLMGKNKDYGLVQAIKLFASKMTIVNIVKYTRIGHIYRKVGRVKVREIVVSCFYAVKFVCGSTILVNSKNWRMSALAIN